MVNAVHFISADELKKEYEVYANFYYMRQIDKNIYMCRNVADIYEIGYKVKNPASLPQALFIMMNPGKCEPKSKKYTIPTLTFEELANISENSPSVLSKPDNAQYQIMRVMYFKGWRHTRIINLSDIKCSKGNQFKTILNNLLNIDTEKAYQHSIFSSKRTSERNYLFTLESNAPIILAWGTDKVIEGLADIACSFLNVIQNAKIKGIKHKGNLYYYPSPPLKEMKLEWLKDILEVI